jgi:leucyl aminopeptidase
MLIDDEDAADEALVPVFGVTPKTLSTTLEKLPAVAAGYAAACRYKGEASEVFLAPGEAGALAAVLVGTGEGRTYEPFATGRLAGAVPPASR